MAMASMRLPNSYRVFGTVAGSGAFREDPVLPFGPAPATRCHPSNSKIGCLSSINPTGLHWVPWVEPKLAVVPAFLTHTRGRLAIVAPLVTAADFGQDTTA